jgi:hypothetical protein
MAEKPKWMATGRRSSPSSGQKLNHQSRHNRQPRRAEEEKSLRNSSFDVIATVVVAVVAGVLGRTGPRKLLLYRHPAVRPVKLPRQPRPMSQAIP